MLGRDISNDKLADAGTKLAAAILVTIFVTEHAVHDLGFVTGPILADVIRDYCYKLNVEDGLQALGYDRSDIPALVEATMPQERVTKLTPQPHTAEDLANILENSMTMY